MDLAHKPSGKESARLLQLRRTPSQRKVFPRGAYTVISGKSEMLSLMDCRAERQTPRRVCSGGLTTGGNGRPRGNHQISLLPYGSLDEAIGWPDLEHTSGATDSGGTAAGCDPDR